MKHGSVDIPYVGSIFVAGKTLAEAKSDIEIVLKEYVSDAAITVKLINNIITVLGEVREPGVFPIYKDRLNLFQALALAGDVSDFGNRYEITIVRQTTDGSIVRELDITDKNIINSEFYYIMPNDVIYVKPIKRKFFGMTSYPYGMFLTMVTAAVSLFLLIQNQILIQQQ
jgi:polysaccharide export outer membrane protein